MLVGQGGTVPKVAVTLEPVAPEAEVVPVRGVPTVVAPVEAVPVALGVPRPPVPDEPDAEVVPVRGVPTAVPLAPGVPTLPVPVVVEVVGRTVLTAPELVVVVGLARGAVAVALVPL
jgi:hypothetical protein